MGQRFAAVASRYDLMNDVLSLGLHRLARRALMAELALTPGSRVLDVAAGSGELALRALRCGAQVVLVDACEAMLAIARHRLGQGCRAVVGEALQLPFADQSFDVAVVGYALRNVRSARRLFEEMGRVVVPGGRVACLEFTQPAGPLRPLFRAYVAAVVPAVGGLVNREAYRYLARSVARVAGAEQVAKAMAEAGLADVRVRPCVVGTMAVHLGRVGAKPQPQGR